MKIAIDYDDTITKSESMWAVIISIIAKEGHEVVIATAREYEGSDIASFRKKVYSLIAYDIPVILTRHFPKMDILQDVDIWIDDFPLGITHGIVGCMYEPCDSVKKDISNV